MPIMKFSSDEEAVKLANDSKYGLGCAVFSGSQQRAKRIASQIHCGLAAVNDFASNYMCQVNFFQNWVPVLSQRVPYKLSCQLIKYLIDLKLYNESQIR